ncbi:very low-density lipoprotein receptor-like [Frankliniella occidentalis]|uniref:Very low-density lipoprotein receptor-like n=1 Tax=Frankliniella occidentalis TaxID=133901 RepID=A0A6J1RRN5_FRAOC|nr:very low-density lipoprotein receptor-like [Frankliniella occidentalis]
MTAACLSAMDAMVRAGGVHAAAALLLLLQATLAHADCPPGHMPCPKRQDKQRCLAPLYACDGYDDCQGGTDERGCRGRCKDGARECDGRCRRAAYWCDGTRDCDDNQDEANCGAGRPTELRTCPQTGALHRDRQLFCDGRNDCTRGYDERGCSSAQDCKAGSYFCLNMKGSERCMHPKTRCNGFQDCRGNEDEKNCPSASSSQSHPTYPATPAPPPGTTTTTATPPPPPPSDHAGPPIEETPALEMPIIESRVPLPTPDAPVEGGSRPLVYLMWALFVLVKVLVVASLYKLRLCLRARASRLDSGVDRAPSFVYLGPSAKRATDSPPPEGDVNCEHKYKERRLVEVLEEPEAEEVRDEQQGNDLGLGQVMASTAADLFVSTLSELDLLSQKWYCDNKQNAL